MQSYERGQRLMGGCTMQDMQMYDSREAFSRAGRTHDSEAQDFNK